MTDKIKENCKFYNDGRCFGTNVFVVDGCNCLLSDGFDNCCGYDDTEYRLQITKQQLQTAKQELDILMPRYNHAMGCEAILKSICISVLEIEIPKNYNEIPVKINILKQQLQTAKEENEKLTQQNKQMREVLNDFNIFFSKVEFTDICQEDINEIVMIARRIPQALKDIDK